MEGKAEARGSETEATGKAAASASLVKTPFLRQLCDHEHVLLGSTLTLVALLRP